MSQESIRVVDFPCRTFFIDVGMYIFYMYTTYVKECNAIQKKCSKKGKKAELIGNNSLKGGVGWN